MIEQLWYTWSTIGLGEPGWQVRASSDGIGGRNTQRFVALNAHLSYILPEGTKKDTATTETSPLCLAFIHLENEHIMVHKVFTGRDSIGRSGVYFVHLLASLPETFAACDAIQLWKSSFWQYSDRTLGSNVFKLPLVSPNELEKGPLNKQHLKAVKDYLPFVIQAFLSLNPQQKLYIMAPDTQVAALIWGLTHSLPRSLQQQLTFSTYEHDVLKASTRIVGACRPTTSVQDAYAERATDIPVSCYGERGFALNFYIGKRSSLAENPTLTDYANFASQSLVEGDDRLLNKLLASAERLHIETSEAFLVIYRFFTIDPQDLSIQDITSLLLTYEVAIELLTQEGIQNAVIDCALHNPEWWKTQGEQAMKDLDERAYQSANTDQGVSMLAAFAEQLVNRIHETLQLGDAVSVHILLKLLWVAAPPSHNPTPWVLLLRGISLQPTIRQHILQEYPWETRAWLLQQWAHAARFIEDTLIAPWLLVPWEGLQKLFILKLVYKWHTLAIKNVLSAPNIPIPQDAVAITRQYHTAFEDALKELLQDPQAQRAALRFFDTLVRYGYQEKLNLLYEMLSVKGCDSTCIDALLHSAQLTTREKVLVFDHCGSQLLQIQGDHLPSLPLLDIITQYIRAFAQERSEHILERLTRATTREKLQLLHLKVLPALLASQVSDWYLASNICFIDDCVPIFKIEQVYLLEMSDAIIRLRLHRSQQYMDSWLLAIINNLWTEADLTCVVETLTHPLEQSPKKLLLRLAKGIGAAYNRTVHSSRLVPYITLALSYAIPLSEHERKAFLEQVFSVLFQNVQRDIFDSIHQESGQWKAQQVELWHTYGLPLRPETTMERIGSFFKTFLSHPPVKQEKATPPLEQPTAQPQTAAGKDTIVNGQLLRWKEVERMAQVRDIFLRWRISVQRKNLIQKGISGEQKEHYLAGLDLRTAELKVNQREKEQVAHTLLVNNLLIEVWLKREGKPWEKSLKKVVEAYLQRLLQDIRDEPTDPNSYHKLCHQITKKEVNRLLSICIQVWHMPSHLEESKQVDWKTFIAAQWSQANFE